MKKDLCIKTFELLVKEYPDTHCALNFDSVFELLVAVELSAQCTDARVNMVTPVLFKKYKTALDLAKADVKDVEDIIRSCGFYKNKAKNLVNAGKYIEENHNGEVPSSIDELIKIPGCGRKTANVVLLEGFGIAEGVAVDTHVKRVSQRIGFSKEQDPEKIEQDLLKIFPKKYYYLLNHVLIDHGRKICHAQKPECEKCVINKMCKTYQS